MRKWRKRTGKKCRKNSNNISDSSCSLTWEYGTNHWRRHEKCKWNAIVRIVEIWCIRWLCIYEWLIGVDEAALKTRNSLSIVPFNRARLTVSGTFWKGKMHHVIAKKWDCRLFHSRNTHSSTCVCLFRFIGGCLTHESHINAVHSLSAVFSQFNQLHEK